MVADEVCGSLQAEGWFRANGLNAETPKCVVSSIEQSPKHGKLVLQADGVTYNYMPDQGFVGNDMIVFIVDAEGKKIRVLWPVDVAEHEITHEGETQLRNEYQIFAPLMSANQLNFSIADLPGAAVGQTVGSNITLDTNAADHNWFIAPPLGQQRIPPHLQPLRVGCEGGQCRLR